MARYIVMLDEPQDAAEALDPIYDDAVTDGGAEAEAVCAHCGDLMAWHEQACVPTVAPVVAAESVAAEPLVAFRTASAFAFELGKAVQPVASVPGQIIWRGQIKEREPESGLVIRINVYGLNNGFWDCYREEELLAA
ncbi:hypothetical protein Q5H93_19655 [Hymenobacter sp. ASUV-10]|uniref:Uncharacterized protein n=1 Tax=Hymenobacter aranciens TaxID=3063996 RepID=A0ABT9BJZ6_9BACT|nr:hypothetical protein [Hymenobacter sp. ASUV-10]MDO7876971.1 hypothetical protein [Hymenobacter sp. ASUV-10]